MELGSKKIHFDFVRDQANSNIYQSFTCDNRYNQKSREEYRFEDYMNHKSSVPNNSTNSFIFDAKNPFYGTPNSSATKKFLRVSKEKLKHKKEKESSVESEKHQDESDDKLSSKTFFLKYSFH